VHVRREEEAEHADHGIERGGSHAESEHVAGAKLDVLEDTLLGLDPGQLKQLVCKIDAK
jgi:hypothetical protein